MEQRGRKGGKGQRSEVRRREKSSGKGEGKKRKRRGREREKEEEQREIKDWLVFTGFSIHESIFSAS